MAVEKDPLQDLKNQFAEMHESLDEIAKNTEPPAEVAKAHIHERRTSAPNQKVDLGKDTKKQILDALKNIRNQIVVSQHRENTMSDVAADALASGQSLAGAAKEALGFKKDKLKASFKRKFDPLNIVHRITGGSKLATVLAGKAMGRSEQSIRSAAGLQPLAETPTPFMGGQDSGAPSPVASDRATTLLQSMATTLTEILDHLTNLNLSSKQIEESTKKESESTEQQATTLDRMRDEAKDTAAVGAVHESQLPTQIDKNGKPVEKKEDSMFKKLLNMLFSPLGLAIASLAAAGVALYAQWENIKTSVSLLKESVLDLWESIKGGFVKMKDWVAGSFTSIYDTILDGVEGTVKGIKSTLNEILPKALQFKIETPEEKRLALEKEVAAGGGGAARAQRKLAAAVAPASQVSKSAESVASGFAQQDQAKNLTPSELEGIRSGKYTEEAVRGLRGESPIKSPAAKILGQALAKSYGDLYRDTTGQPLHIQTDPESENRLKSLAPEVSSRLADSIASQVPTSTRTGVPTASAAPMELPAPAPSSGQTLTQANDLQRNAATEAPGGGKNTAAVINNVNNQVTNAPTFNQGMPPARSGESSYQRSLDRHYVPA
jgi:hypothetical protein